MISKKDITPKWKRKVLSALTKITQEADKSIYENPEAFCRFFQDNAAGISSRKNRALVARLLFAFAHQRGFITRQQLEELKGHVRVKRIRPDRYVPTQDEVRATLARLPQHHRQAFLTLLYSGLRLSELQYLVERKVELRAQAINGFVKVELAYERRTKSAFFAYLPRELWTQLPTSFSVNALEDYVHRKDCLRAKYLRKIFYTTAIRIGCPAEVADFIQGRVQRTVGGNHYLALQQLADIWYPKIAREFSRGKLT